MPGLVFGGLILVVGLLLMRAFVNANPGVLARRLRAGGGLALLALGALMLLTGRPVAAVGLLALGLGLLGAGVDFSRGRRREAPNAGSRVRTKYLEMRLDHATGAITGTVLAGAFSGRALDQMKAAELERLVGEVDPESLSLLEAYLQRRSTRGGADAQGDADGSRARGRASEMGKEEAYQVLGLQPGAGADEIRRAHRALMMKIHPDQGGSTYLAARVNEAKEVLLGRHG